MSKRRKNRARAHHHTSGQGNGHDRYGPAWACVNPPPPPGVEVVPIFVCPAPAETPTPPSEEDEIAAESGYNKSRGNATTHGMRSEKVFPESMAALIEERTAAFTAEMHPGPLSKPGSLASLLGQRCRWRPGPSGCSRMRRASSIGSAALGGRLMPARPPSAWRTGSAGIHTGPPASSRLQSNEHIYLFIILMDWLMPLGARTHWMTFSAAYCLMSWACPCRCATATGASRRPVMGRP